MRGKLWCSTFLALLLVAASYKIHAGTVQESAPPFQVSSLQPLEGEGVWDVPGSEGLKVKVQRRSGNGPKGWLVDMVGHNKGSNDYFYLLDGATKYDRSALYLGQLDGRPALISWQPALTSINTFPSPQRVPREVNFWVFGDDVIKRCGPYPHSAVGL